MWVTTTNQTTATWPTMVSNCMVCAIEVEPAMGGALCELCRQAILKFREAVLAQMARELMEMVGEAEDSG